MIAPARRFVGRETAENDAYMLSLLAGRWASLADGFEEQGKELGDVVHERGTGLAVQVCAGLLSNKKKSAREQKWTEEEPLDRNDWWASVERHRLSSGLRAMWSRASVKNP